MGSGSALKGTAAGAELYVARAKSPARVLGGLSPKRCGRHRRKVSVHRFQFEDKCVELLLPECSYIGREDVDRFLEGNRSRIEFGLVALPLAVFTD
jgi:hypothetical protein